MMLSQLVKESPVPEDVSFNGICEDSRMIRQGNLFCAVKGEQSDGRQYIDAAIDKGAVAVLCEQPGPSVSVPVVEVDHLACRSQIVASPD